MEYVDTKIDEFEKQLDTQEMDHSQIKEVEQKIETQKKTTQNNTRKLKRNFNKVVKHNLAPMIQMPDQ